MAEAVIVEAVRSPVGKRNGGLSGVHPGELSAQPAPAQQPAQRETSGYPSTEHRGTTRQRLGTL